MSGARLDVDRRPGFRAKRRKRGRLGCLVALIALVVVCLAAYAGVSKGVAALSDWLGPPDDYSGQGSGKVQVEISKGDSVAQMGRTLKSDGVIASVDAFIGVASGDDRARSIQPGFYELREKMSAKWALEELLDPANRVKGAVTVPEGARVGQIVKAIAAHTDISQRAVVAALDHPAHLGLPAAAKDNPEGYLFPSTYQVRPGTSAVDLLRQMVAKTKTVDRRLHLRKRARALGVSAEQAVTVASIIEYEAKRDADLPKVARVIYNRLDEGMALQLDSTVSYVSNREGDPWTTAAERSSESAYNTYKHRGLPPGPIGSPGRKTLQAALEPAHGNWLYFVTTNFETGRTAFTDSYRKHLRNVKKSREYCKGSELC